MGNKLKISFIKIDAGERKIFKWMISSTYEKKLASVLTSFKKKDKNLSEPQITQIFTD